MNDLANYDEACRLIANAVRVDEAAEIRSKADALRVYAKQAKNLDLEIHCAQIRSRAERRLGEILLAAKEAGQLAEGRPKNCADEEQFSRVTLAAAGIDRKLSSRAQRTAEIGDVRFEALMTMMRQQAEAGGRVITDVLKVDRENEQRDARRDLAKALSETSRALSPKGQRVPCIYADPPWERKQGVTDRSYENHYGTMTWAEICAMPVKDRVLDDAWLFLWIPRAHMFARHKVVIEAMVAATGEMVIVELELPLAHAVAKAWGFDHFCTAFVWTKTDEEHPNDQGGGVLVFDQDEILLMFRRGRGLPKPATDEKFKSNYRERKREHSRKPEHYRNMIRAMTGGVPVLELFARVDDENPLPPDWLAWGNQAAPELDPDVVLDSGVDSSVPVVVGTDLSSEEDLNAEVVVEQEDGEQHPVKINEPSWDVSRETSPDLNYRPRPPAEFDEPCDDLVAIFRRELSGDQFPEWEALDTAERNEGIAIASDMYRHLIGEGWAAEKDAGLMLTPDGEQRLRALRAYVERSERRLGRTLGYSLDINPPATIDLEQLFAAAPDTHPSSELPI